MVFLGDGAVTCVTCVTLPELLASHAVKRIDCFQVHGLLENEGRQRCRILRYTASKDVSPKVNGMIFGSKLPGGLVPDLPSDARCWLSVILAEMFCLVVCSAW